MPADLPQPADDGLADHLPGEALPAVELPSTLGSAVRLDRLGSGRAAIFVYPMMGAPGRALPADWDLIPGARGCTPEACGFRDRHHELRQRGLRIYGLSAQPHEDQVEAARRLGLPFPLLSDPGFALDAALGMPTFDADGRRFYKRLTLIASAGTIERVFYPVFPPSEHAGEVLDWLVGAAA